MNRVPDIRFIDSHAKCFCRYHPSEFVIFIFSLYQRLFFFQRFVTGISFWSTARIPFYPGFKFPLKLPAQLVASLSPIDIRCKDQSTSRITLLRSKYIIHSFIIIKSIDQIIIFSILTTFYNVKCQLISRIRTTGNDIFSVFDTKLNLNIFQSVDRCSRSETQKYRCRTILSNCLYQIQI